jgi:DeoR/GlpR family transcriptional regulator of sugar metabolism
MARGTSDIRGRSLVEGLILAVRTVVLHVEDYDRLRRAGADEFTQARVRREMVEAARRATRTADLSEVLHARAMAAVARLDCLRASNTDHPEPPDDPPPEAA